MLQHMLFKHHLPGEEEKNCDLMLPLAFLFVFNKTGDCTVMVQILKG